jgi:hypothetical protein
MPASRGIYLWLITALCLVSSARLSNVSNCRRLRIPGAKAANLPNIEISSKKTKSAAPERQRFAE